MLILILGNVGNSQCISQEQRNGFSRFSVGCYYHSSTYTGFFLRPPSFEFGYQLHASCLLTTPCGTEGIKDFSYESAVFREFCNG